ncbi:sugar phosphate isomerase/epimerase [Rhizobium vallis]|uniref:Sugar phosphate isomerase/epimerase n=1 Tax=Rhizobium vallis TaxID=634290 RepID=A0A3S0QLF3_9HYPH|nr:sugar phosphate isomerase/epimerase [Rhizobium vallis]RUM20438.1 sugar phosphate isomerase/epimerase [Rhizobium vallis]
MTELSFQLYSARNYPSFSELLTKLSEIGFKQVEGYGGLYADAAALRAELDKNRLSMPTGHFSLDQLKDTDAALQTAETLGMKRLHCPSISPDKRSEHEAEWLELAETLASIGEKVTAAGYGFGWHNHDFEFKATTTGRTPMEIILETAPKIEWECDVAWVLRGKVDPLTWFDRYGDRISAVHVKDISTEGENLEESGWADVGHGIVGWDNMIKEVKSRTKAQYFVAEHDNPTNAIRFGTRSFATVSKWK